MKPNQPCNYLNRGHKSKVNIFGQYSVDGFVTIFIRFANIFGTVVALCDLAHDLFPILLLQSLTAYSI